MNTGEVQRIINDNSDRIQSLNKTIRIQSASIAIIAIALIIHIALT